MKKTYLYRCTEQQLEEHLQRIAEAGDVVEHVVFKGGRDYVLVCRPGAALGTVSNLSPAEASELITTAVVAAFKTRDRSVVQYATGGQLRMDGAPKS